MSSKGKEIRGEASLLEELIVKLDVLMKRIERIEKILNKSGLLSEEAISALNIFLFSSLPFSIALESAARALRIISKFRELDSLSKSIIHVLSSCEELSISEVYRRIKGIRGKGSRRVISRKLKVLEALNIVMNTGSYRRPKYTLRECLSGVEN